MYHRGARAAGCDRSAERGWSTRTARRTFCWCWIGLVTLAAVLQRSLSWNWRTRSPGQGIAAFSNVKRICASRVSSVSWFSTAAVAYWQETAAASVQQPVEEESRPGGKSGSSGPHCAAKRVPYARVSTCRCCQHSGSRSGSGSKVEIKIQVK